MLCYNIPSLLLYILNSMLTRSFHITRQKHKWEMRFYTLLPSFLFYFLWWHKKLAGMTTNKQAKKAKQKTQIRDLT